MFSAKNRSSSPEVVNFDFVKEDRRVGMYYLTWEDPQSSVMGYFLPGCLCGLARGRTSSWSARSEAGTDELDLGEGRRTI